MYIPIKVLNMTASVQMDSDKKFTVDAIVEPSRLSHEEHVLAFMKIRDTIDQFIDQCNKPLGTPSEKEVKTVEMFYRRAITSFMDIMTALDKSTFSGCDIDFVQVTMVHIWDGRVVLDTRYASRNMLLLKDFHTISFAERIDLYTTVKAQNATIFRFLQNADSSQQDHISQCPPFLSTEWSIGKLSSVPQMMFFEKSDAREYARWYAEHKGLTYVE